MSKVKLDLLNEKDYGMVDGDFVKLNNIQNSSQNTSRNYKNDFINSPKLQNHLNETLKNKYKVLPDGVNKGIITDKPNNVIRHLKAQANFVCRNFITQEYIKTSFNKFSLCFYYKDIINDRLIGFCLLKARKKQNSHYKNDIKSLEILLICTIPNDSNLGKIILFDVEEYGKKHNFHMIQLKPLNASIIQYYESIGYKVKKEKTSVFMEKSIRDFNINLKIPKTRKVKRLKK